MRRWTSRLNRERMAGLVDRPWCGQPLLGGRRLTRRIAALLARPGPWTLPRIWRYLGQPQVSLRAPYRRVRQVAIWRRPKMTARGDPARDQAVADIMARLLELPRRAVVYAEDQTHLNLLPHVRASWTLRGKRPDVATPGKNRQVTVFGAIETTTGRWVYRLGCRCAAELIALVPMLTEAFPRPGAGVLAADESRCCLREWLARVPDPLSRLGRWHPLEFALALAICAFTATGHDSPTAVAEWAAGCSQDTLALLGGRRDPWTRRIPPPRAGTFSRVSGHVDAEAFNGALYGYLAAMPASPPQALPAVTRHEREQRRATAVATRRARPAYWAQYS